MNGQRLRTLLLCSAGFAVLLLLGVANSSPTVPLTQSELRKPSIVLDAIEPVTGVNPFKPISKNPPPPKPVEDERPSPMQTVGELPEPKVEPAPVATPAAPDLHVEGVVAGADPVAVVRLGSESFVLRVGERFGDGLQVIAIKDSEVVVKGPLQKYVLKTPH